MLALLRIISCVVLIMVGAPIVVYLIAYMIGRGFFRGKLSAISDAFRKGDDHGEEEGQT